MSVDVRPVRRDDLDALVVLCAEHAAYERAAFNAEGLCVRLEQAFFAEPARLLGWIAEAREPVGYLTATRDFSTWRARKFLHMDCLYVREGHRGAGVGLRLFAALRAHACAAGIDEIQWQTPHWNRDAARFYRRLGAVEATKLRYRLQAR
jgi:GNAT superfamily N-acetyltransferase